MSILLSVKQSSPQHNVHLDSGGGAATGSANSWLLNAHLQFQLGGHIGHWTAHTKNSPLNVSKTGVIRGQHLHWPLLSRILQKRAVEKWALVKNVKQLVSRWWSSWPPIGHRYICFKLIMITTVYIDRLHIDYIYIYIDYITVSLKHDFLFSLPSLNWPPGSAITYTYTYSISMWRQGGGSMFIRLTAATRSYLMVSNNWNDPGSPPAVSHPVRRPKGDYTGWLATNSFLLKHCPGRISVLWSHIICFRICWNIAHANKDFPKLKSFVFYCLLGSLIKITPKALHLCLKPSF